MRLTHLANSKLLCFDSILLYVTLQYRIILSYLALVYFNRLNLIYFPGLPIQCKRHLVAVTKDEVHFRLAHSLPGT